MLRGGAFKPRTSPYSFQGLEKEGLKLLAKARKESGLPFVTEVTNPEDVELVGESADMLQIGTRSVQNFFLLRRAGRFSKPILLKGGMSTTIQGFLMSAEYVLAEGCRNVILCERGIRTFENATRNTLDISAVPGIHERSHLPIIVDPSHATGSRNYVAPLCYAAITCAADGLIIEVHPQPLKAMCDGPQSLNIEDFSRLMERLRNLSTFSKREL